MFGDAVRERICLIARTSPSDWGMTAFYTWSLSKLLPLQRATFVHPNDRTNTSGQRAIITLTHHMQDQPDIHLRGGFSGLAECGRSSLNAAV